MNFEDNKSAFIWIIDNQFGRRNISDFVRTELALKRKEIIAIDAEGRRLSKLKQNVNIVPQKSAERKQGDGQGDGQGDTRDKVAKLAGVSHTTVGQVEKILEKAPEHIIKKARSGDLKVKYK